MLHSLSGPFDFRVVPHNEKLLLCCSLIVGWICPRPICCTFAKKELILPECLQWKSQPTQTKHVCCAWWWNFTLCTNFSVPPWDETQGDAPWGGMELRILMEMKTHSANVHLQCNCKWHCAVTGPWLYGIKGTLHDLAVWLQPCKQICGLTTLSK